MDNFRRFFALFFSICASISILIFAMARHKAPISGNGDIYNIIAEQMLFHAFLGMLICVFHEKFGKFYYIPIAFCFMGISLFCFPVLLRANGIIEHSPTAPLGGIFFSLSWLSAGISILFNNKQVKQTNDIN